MVRISGKGDGSREAPIDAPDDSLLVTGFGPRPYTALPQVIHKYMKIIYLSRLFSRKRRLQHGSNPRTKRESPGSIAAV